MKTSRKPGSPTRTYPQPKNEGGKLMREWVRSMRSFGLELPLTSHILCALSSGSDSTAMGVALAKYGRRIVSNPKNIVFVHVNHGWRGVESDRDETFVRDLAERLGVQFRTQKLKTEAKPGESLEDVARTDRKGAFRKWSQEFKNAPVLTAHTADDLYETQIWRFFTGAWNTHGEGIRGKHEIEIRPFLNLTRKNLQAFLEEESEAWREDSSNRDSRFLRARIRHDLIPVLASLFPGAQRSVRRNLSPIEQATTKSVARPLSRTRKKPSPKKPISPKNSSLPKTR